MLSWISGTNSFEVSSVSSIRPCSLCGYLYKMKRRRKLLVPQWNKRWFSIEGKYFRWYTNPTDEEPSGSLDLKKVSYITRFEMQGAYSFIVGYPDRNLMLRTDSQVDLDKWIRALNMQADVARGGNGMNVITGSPSIPTSPEGKNKANNGKQRRSFTLEAELDRSMRQLQDLERKYCPSSSVGSVNGNATSESQYKSLATDENQANNLGDADAKMESRYSKPQSQLQSSGRRPSGSDQDKRSRAEEDDLLSVTRRLYDSNVSATATSQAAESKAVGMSSSQRGSLSKTFEANSDDSCLEEADPKRSPSLKRSRSNRPSQQGISDSPKRESYHSSGAKGEPEDEVYDRPVRLAPNNRVSGSRSSSISNKPNVGGSSNGNDDRTPSFRGVKPTSSSEDPPSYRSNRSNRSSSSRQPLDTTAEDSNNISVTKASSAQRGPSNSSTRRNSHATRHGQPGNSDSDDHDDGSNIVIRKSAVRRLSSRQSSDGTSTAINAWAA